MNRRKVLTLAFLALVLAMGYYSMSAAPVKSTDGYSYHGGVQWHNDVSEARDAAARQNKPILVYFWTTWCTYCEDYNKRVYPAKSVRKELDEFVLLAVNMANDKPSMARLKQRYDANYPPQHVVITPEGEQVTKLAGYAPKDEFLNYLRRSQRQYQR